MVFCASLITLIGLNETTESSENNDLMGLNESAPLDPNTPATTPESQHGRQNSVDRSDLAVKPSHDSAPKDDPSAEQGLATSLEGVSTPDDGRTSGNKSQAIDES